MAYSRAKLVQYIVDALESGKKTDTLSRDIAAYLIDSGKTADLESVIRDAQDMRARKYGTVEVDVVSAHELTKSIVGDVEAIASRQYPNAKQVTVNQIHDSNVVGGAKVSFAHASVDLTVRAKLNRLREGINQV